MEISRFLGMTIGFCGDYGNPAHVHVHYDNYNALITVDGLAIGSGSLPPRVAALAIEWVMLNADAIKRNWSVLKAGGMNLAPIPPLVS